MNPIILWSEETVPFIKRMREYFYELKHHPQLRDKYPSARRRRAISVKMGESNERPELLVPASNLKY